MFNTPILYIIFNRLDTVKQTFPQIRKQQPRQLFIAADGPRITRVGEAEKCAAVREWVMGQIDWQCDVQTLFRDENLGCGTAVYGALKWFFENVEYGIILEDDCLPNKSFFSYCQELLIKYNGNKNIGMISGRNSCNTSFINPEYSYSFTTGGGIWGWATWKNIFEKYNPFSDFYEKTDLALEITKFTKDKQESEFIVKQAAIAMKQKDTWDYQWGVYLKYNHLLAVTPKVNLIHNIGFSADSTHFTGNESPDISNDTELEFPLTHPDKIKANYVLSQKMASTCFERKNLLAVIKKIIKKIIFWDKLKVIIKPEKNKK